MAVKTLQQPNYEWIDLLNPEKEELQTIANQCNLNYYNLADSLEPNHLPKFETENDINFFIVRMVHKNAKKESTIENFSNKIAIFYNDKTIISIHRVTMDFISTIEEKYVILGKTPSTTSLVIKILYAVLQTYNDSILTTINKLDFFEKHLFTKHPSTLVLQNIYSLKRKTNLCTQMLILTDEVIKSIKPSFQEKASYQDLKDLYVKLTTLHKQVTEDLNNLLNLYISLSSQKTNEIMKTLTIFSIFFMPLTFIVGIYGMNFKYMPELDEKWSYPIIMLAMLLITLLIYYWLKKKKWL